MAARKGKITLSDTWKERISAGMIMERLQRHVDGTLELSATQINAAKILLSKVVPDLTRTTLAGDSDNPVIISEIRRTIIDPKT